MHVDLGNVLDTTPGLTEETLDRLDSRVADAHDRIATGMADDEFGYAALNLPETADPDAIRAATDQFDRLEAVLTVGIGGSALGAATLANALESDVDAYFLDNVDPDAVASLLDRLPSMRPSSTSSRSPGRPRRRSRTSSSSARRWRRRASTGPTALS